MGRRAERRSRGRKGHKGPKGRKGPKEPKGRKERKGRKRRRLQVSSPVWRDGVVGVCSVGKARGCTVVAVTLAWLLQTEAEADSVVVEADESGGDLNSWWGLGMPRASAAMTGRLKSGMEMQEAARSSASANGVGMVRVVCTSSDGAGVEPLVRTWAQQKRGENRRGAAESDSAVVVADLGRWNRRQRVAERVELCDLVVALVEPSVAGIDRAKTVLAALRQRCGRIVVAQVGSRPYSAGVVSRELDCEIRVVTIDKKAERSVSLGDPKEGLRKSRTARSLRRLMTGAEPESYIDDMAGEGDAGDAVEVEQR